ncbi:hypothetical protein GCM10009660_15370 [Catellatospora bangladeshensis]
MMPVTCRTPARSSGNSAHIPGECWKCKVYLADRGRDGAGRARCRGRAREQMLEPTAFPGALVGRARRRVARIPQAGATSGPAAGGNRIPAVGCSAPADR